VGDTSEGARRILLDDIAPRYLLLTTHHGPASTSVRLDHSQARTVAAALSAGAPVPDPPSEMSPTLYEALLRALTRWECAPPSKKTGIRLHDDVRAAITQVANRAADRAAVPPVPEPHAEPAKAWKGFGGFSWTDTDGATLARVIDNGGTPVIHIVVPDGEHIWKGFDETIIAQRWQHARRWIAELRSLAAPSPVPTSPGTPTRRRVSNVPHLGVGDLIWFEAHGYPQIETATACGEQVASTLVTRRADLVRCEACLAASVPPSDEEPGQ
jgi:hypothetical protein